MNRDDKKRILLVEDEAITAMLETQQLEKYGYSVHHVTTGEDALKTMLDNTIPVDLILMDINLGPGIDGTQAAEQILNHKDIPIVFLSSHTEPEVVEKTEKITSYGYVVKNSGIVVIDASIKMAFRLFEAKTKEKKQEQALRLSEEKYKGLIEGLNDAVYRMTLPDGKYEYFSSSVEDVFGYTSEEFINDPLFVQRIIHPEYACYFKKKWKELLEGNVQEKYEYKIIDSKGNERWIVQSNKAIFDDSGKIKAIEGLCRNVTDLKKSEYVLYESELLLKSTVDGLSAHIVVLDDRGEIILANKSYRDFAEMNGVEPVTVSKGTNYLAVCDTASGQNSEESKTFAEGIREIISGKRQFFELEYPCHSSDEKRWFIGRVTPFPGEVPRRVIVAHENITERKQAEEKLQESESRLSATLHSIGDGVITTDASGNVTSLNEVAEHLTGWTTPEVAGKPVDEIFHIINAHTREKAVNPMARTIKEGVIVGLANDTVLVARDGTEHQIADSCAPIKDNNGNVIGTVLVFRDVTEDYQRLAALRESEKKFRSIFAYMTEIVVLHELVGDENDTPVNYRIIDCNPAFTRITGIRREEAVGRLATDVYGSDSAPYLDEYARVVLTGEPCAFTTAYAPMDKYFEIHATSSGKNKFVTVTTDITDRKRAEEALKASNEMLAETERIGKVGGWSFNIDTLEQKWTDEVYRIHEVEIEPNPSVEAGINYYTKESRPIIEEAVQRAIEHGENYDLELEVITAKGNTRAVHTIGKVDLKNRRIYGFFHDITDRKRAEQDIKQSRDQYQSLMENIPGITYRCKCDTDWTMLFMSDAVDPLSGYPSSDFIGNAVRTYKSVIHPDDNAFVAKSVNTAVADGQSWDIEYRIRHKDGGIRWVHEKGRVVLGEDGSVDYLDGFILDITERKRAEEQLIESEALFRGMFNDHSAVMLLVEPTTGQIVKANHAAAQYYGYPLKTIIKMNIQQLNVLSPTEITDKIGRATNRQVNIFEFPHMLADGQVRDVQVHSAPITIQNQKLLFSIIHDITDRKRAEQQIAEFNQDFVAFLEYTTDFIYFKDKTSRFRFCSQTLANITGHAHWRDMVGKHDLEVFPAETAQIYYEEELPIFREGLPLLNKIDPYFDASGNKRWVSTSKWPLRGKGGEVVGLFGISRDITERKQAEEALVKAKDAAETANKAKSEFLSVMSHELRTPLNPILGFTTLLVESPNLTEEQRNWLSIVNQRGKDLLDLINSVLDLAKIEAGQVEIQSQQTALRATIHSLFSTIKPLADKKGLRMELDIESDVPEDCLTDGLRIRQILLNLLNNALKFTTAGSITMRVRHGNSADISRPLNHDETVLLFSVQDTGIGIPEDRQSVIFEDFTQADHRHAVDYGGGAGLGLSVARQLTELLGGKIWVESHMGQGSTFFFTIIVGVCRADPIPDTVQEEQRARCGKTLKILIAEDDPASAMLAEYVVRQAGHKSRTVHDGKQALALLAKEPFDAVLMDVEMPVMDGLTATRRIRETEVCGYGSVGVCEDGHPQTHTLTNPHTSTHRIPIIAMTANALKGDREKCIEAGMDDYISKPINLNELVSAADRLVEVMQDE